MKIKRGLQWLALFLFIISFSVFVAINFRPLYVFDVSYLNILDYTDVSKEVLLDNFSQLMSFLNNPFNTTLALPDFPMSVSGAQHFYDVKKLFLLDYAILLVTMIPAIWFLVSLVKQKALWKLIRPFQIALVIPIIFGFLMAIGFDTFFVKFHELFFANDDWLFNPATDPIINVLPEAFFMHCFILFFVLIEVIFLSGVIAGRLQLKRNR